MDEEYLEPGFEYWSFDCDYVREEPRTLSAWTYNGDNNFENDLSVRVNAERDGFLFIPPYQFFASEPKGYSDLDTAYREAVDFVKSFDVDQLGDSE